MDNKYSLYIHIPFCSGKCDYCDFYSVPVKPGDPILLHYAETVLNEAEFLFDKYRPSYVPSIYIGGGTPSLLGSGVIFFLLKGIFELISRYTASPASECTVECNPESLTENFLESVKTGGVNRLSLGIQTFNSASRKMVNRTGAGNEEDLIKSLSLVDKYFNNAFSVDLISGLPLQTEKILLDDIAHVLDYNPSHVSLYELTTEPGTPLFSKTKIINDNAPDLYLAGRDALEKALYSQYEVSNFARKGGESIHNIRYWQMKSWLAIGPSASGTIINEPGKAFRYTYHRDIENWFSNTVHGDKSRYIKEELDKKTLVKETFLMGFRYINGPDEKLFRQRFGTDVHEVIPHTLDKWKDKLNKDIIALTKDGLLFLNPFLIDAFSELDS